MLKPVERPYERVVATDDGLEEVLRSIRLAPTAVAFPFKFNTLVVNSNDQYPHKTRGWLVWIEFERTDCNGGDKRNGNSPKWFVPRYSATSDVVRTAYSLFEWVVRHEMAEAFTYDEKQVFDPHRTLAEPAFPVPGFVTGTVPPVPPIVRWGYGIPASD